jgi:hypothetical protein
MPNPDGARLGQRQAVGIDLDKGDRRRIGRGAVRSQTKSAVASVKGRKFLGYSFWFGKEGVKRRVADKPMASFKQRVRQLIRRSGGRSMAEVIGKLKLYLLGWKAYFGLAQTPRVWLMTLAAE